MMAMLLGPISLAFHYNDKLYSGSSIKQRFPGERFCLFSSFSAADIAVPKNNTCRGIQQHKIRRDMKATLRTMELCSEVLLNTIRLIVGIKTGYFSRAQRQMVIL